MPLMLTCIIWRCCSKCLIGRILNLSLVQMAPLSLRRHACLDQVPGHACMSGCGALVALV